MRTVPVFMLLAVLCCSASAAPVEPAQEEIEHLLTYLGSSACSFARNGKWHSARRAVEHLQDKYRALRKKGVAVSTAESFIEQVATHSNVSGHPYLVRCGNHPAVESGSWFREELMRFRKERPLAATRSLQPALVLSPHSSAMAARPHPQV